MLNKGDSGLSPRVIYCGMNIMVKKSGFRNSGVSLVHWIQQQIKAGAEGGRVPTPEELKIACALVGINPSLCVKRGLRPGLDPTAHPEYRRALDRLRGLLPDDELDPTPNPSIELPQS